MQGKAEEKLGGEEEEKGKLEKRLGNLKDREKIEV